MNREKINSISVEEYVSLLSLKPHPEGGFFRETYRSSESIPASFLSDRFIESRNLSTSIYYLLDRESFSSFHRIKSDEIWHFYNGCGLYIYEIDKVGNYVTHKLGNNLKEGFSFQITIKSESWFAAENINKLDYSLVGCTVAPGFDFNDFEIAKRDELLQEYPQFNKDIIRLTK
jgi:predicted cupin superfamily sugar epimerase